MNMVAIPMCPKNVNPKQENQVKKKTQRAVSATRFLALYMSALLL
jgi:hypothetical protein